MTTRLIAAALTHRCWALVLPVLLGCGGGLDAHVAGTVLLNGQPLKLAPGQVGTVKFHPVGPGTTAYSQIDRSGRYLLKSGQQKGLLPGEYRVTVVATHPPDSTDPRGEYAVPKRLTPERYGQLDSSPLTFTVEPGRNAIDLPLATSATGS